MAKKLDNSQLISSELIKKSFEESLLEEEKEKIIKNGQYNRRLHEYFEYFSADLILKAYDLSDEEIEKGVVGSGNDGGCDSLYLFVNDELILDDTPLENVKKNPILDFYIIQSKFETSFRESAFDKWKSVVDNLFSLDTFKNTDFSMRYNNELLESFERFHNTFLGLITKSPIVNFKFIYVSLGNEIHVNVKQQAEEVKSKLKNLYPSPNTSVIVDFIDAQKILALYDAPAKTDFVLHISESPIIVTEEKEYIVLADLKQYFDFITNENNKLIKHIFEANVRDYQGKTTVNKEIAETLEEMNTEEDFWWLNNGITMLANKIDQKSTKVFEIKNPEIVNGLQTSTEIYNYFTSKAGELEEITENRRILIRIIVPNSDASRDNIILATNSQTAIPKAILRGTDSIHREIENYLKTKDLFYDRRKNFYKNEGKPKEKIISIAFLAQCLISILLRKPNYARARPSTLLNDEETYKYLYITNQNLDSYYKAALIGKRVKQVINSLGLYTVSEQSDISFYVMLVCSAKIIGSKEITPEQLGNIKIDEFSDTNIKVSADYVYEKYKKLGGNNKVAKGTKLIDEILKEDYIIEPFNQKILSVN
ncbi:AIPR family protein [Bacillus kwashiorkori]|uniref:AIPR family protein n=1 Tax=Bacillus kwashiorkori TaxID=1522318 RepID=UPI0007819DC3|nr:AIPR family protein [Bacillus kwashiorkori]